MCWIKKELHLQRWSQSVTRVEQMSRVEANNWMAENMIPYYPLGDLKDSVKVEH
ncbi:hypothetical protein [Draconibacterium sp.]|uniref:hypothetical protein n=1 Tax=Draconibacterium sp. TaxID=1965318 RepID=UPI003568CC09